MTRPKLQPDPDAPEVFRLTVPGHPVPAARMTQAQVKMLSRGRTLTNGQIARYPDWKNATGWLASAAGALPMGGRLQLTVDVFLKSRGSGDADNYLKAAADALQGIAFCNDNQIDSMTVRIHTKATCEGMEIELRRLDSLAR